MTCDCSVTLGLIQSEGSGQARSCDHPHFQKPWADPAPHKEGRAVVEMKTFPQEILNLDSLSPQTPGNGPRGVYMYMDLKSFEKFSF